MSKQEKSPGPSTRDERSENEHKTIAVQPGEERQRSPSIPSDCPPGLEHLSTASCLLVKQHVTPFWKTNKYAIFNESGNQIYMVIEEMYGFGRSRKYRTLVLDTQNQVVMRCRQPEKCCRPNGWCDGYFKMCTHETTVEAPPGNVVGVVRQAYAACGFKFVVVDSNDKHQLSINIARSTAGLREDLIFTVHSPGTGQVIGDIRKKWAGIVKEFFTTADNFEVNFPVDMDVNTKASLLGAVFLIDFMIFERSGS